ncbi:hypothetical protein OIU79_011403 [Salix purpurea]|uniref:Uncharacterized protein n=1 Tax=Salix purpurea TaxID=77065 RepID=A0A9Q0T2A5_SALPP|nr:hypothetical protein OIU79_011403 [Salix purpurea]
MASLYKLSAKVLSSWLSLERVVPSGIDLDEEYTAGMAIERRMLQLRHIAIFKRLRFLLGASPRRLSNMEGSNKLQRSEIEPSYLYVAIEDLSGISGWCPRIACKILRRYRHDERSCPGALWHDGPQKIHQGHIVRNPDEKQILSFAETKSLALEISGKRESVI